MNLHLGGGVRTSRSKGLQAFTLAEVLITLGIIGVVAAITLPTLISNYQKRVYVTQLKKSVSVLSQGFTTMMGHDGVTRLSDTEAFSGMADLICVTTGGERDFVSPRCSTLKKGLESVFSGIQFTPCDGTNYKSLNGSRTSVRSSFYTCIKFPDGLEIFDSTMYKTPRYNVEHPSGGVMGYVGIDLNGSKNPNIRGRDIFDLYIGNNGAVYGAGSKIVSEMLGEDDRYSSYWRTLSDMMIRLGMGCATNSEGDGCAGRVLEEDAMNY